MTDWVAGWLADCLPLTLCLCRFDNGREFEFIDEPWRACEALFTAPLFRSLDVVGLQGAIYHVIKSCPIDQRARLYSGIELMGGSTCFDGLAQRLEAELRAKMTSKSLSLSPSRSSL